MVLSSLWGLFLIPQPSPRCHRHLPYSGKCQLPAPECQQEKREQSESWVSIHRY